MTETVSKTKILLARFVVVLMLAFVVLGALWYGVSAEVLERIWRNMIDRTGGPMTFRFFLQPIMATIAAVYDGVKDARAGRSYYLWTILTNPAKHGGRLHEGLISTARVILLGLCVDSIYRASCSRGSIPPRRSSLRSCSPLSPTCLCVARSRASRAGGAAINLRTKSGEP